MPIADCRVWTIDLAAAPARCELLLSEPEQARAASIRQDAARRRFAVATALLKVTVAAATGRAAREVVIRRECPDCRRLHGRPTIAGGTPHVSISHAGDRVAVAHCAAGPVGVDVEQVTADLDVDAMAAFVFSDTELPVLGRLDFFRCWTRKESVLKATGDGLRTPMRNLSLGTPRTRPRLTGFTGRPELTATARIADLHPGPGYVGAVTVLSAHPVRVAELDGAAAFAAATW